MDGMEIIRKIREWSDTPILVISARVQEDDKVLALDSGADDYITKPFGNSELLARIRTALRHVNRLKTDAGQTNRPYRSHGLVIDFQKRLITRDSAEIHLTQNEFKIVSLLAQNCGQVLTYDRLIAHVWGPYSENDTTSLRVHMANIRRESWSLILQSRCISLQKSELDTGWWMRMKRKTPPGGRGVQGNLRPGGFT